MKKQLLVALAMAVLLPVGVARAIDSPVTGVIPMRDDTTTREINKPGTGLTQEQKRQQVTTAKQEAKQKVEQAKAEAQNRKLQLSAQKCTSYKDRVAAVVPKLSNGLTTVKSRLDTHYQKVQDIYAKNVLTVNNYDQLKADVDAAKAAAETAIETIDHKSVVADCENRDLGTQLNSYRSTIKAAREKVKAYHHSLVTLVSAMKSANEKTDTADAANKTTQEAKQ